MDVRFSVIELSLLVLSVTCYSYTTFRHRGLCQFSLKDSKSEELYTFDLSWLKGKHILTNYSGQDLPTYISLCELYTDNSVVYRNPCSGSSVVCFYSTIYYDASNTLVTVDRSYFKWIFNHKVTDPIYDVLSQTLNVTFEERSDRTKKIILQLVCGKEDGLPEFVSVQSSYQFVFKWSSRAACPINDLSIRNKCILKNPDTNYSLDLRSLRHESYYKIEDGESTYEINICGTIQNGTCKGDNVTICKISDSEEPVIIAYDNGYGFYQNERGVRLVYKAKIKTDIAILCDEKTVNREITVRNSSSKTLKLQIKSPLSCIPHYYRCLIKKNNMQYDLRSLRKGGSNYIIENYKNNYSFVLNVCGYLVDDHLPKTYSGKNVFICKNDKNNIDEITYGRYNENGVSLIRPGYLEIVYTGGSKCYNGSSWSTRIKLFCSVNGVESLKYDKSDNISCIHSFSWKTKHACPFKLNYGKNCIVKEQYSSADIMHYSFLPLSSTAGSDITIANGSYIFRLNICDRLLQPCNNDDTAAVCLAIADEEIVIGRFESEPISKRGDKYFDMTGDPCYYGGPISRTFVYMKCNFSQFYFEPRLIYSDRKECLFIFEWYTKYACTPLKQQSCKFHIYDLQPLILRWDNYIVSVNETTKFALNVCQNLIRGINSFCPMNAAGCLINMNDNQTYEYSSKAIGLVSDMSYNGYTHDNYLSITYSKGDECVPGRQYSVTYVFECYPFLVNSLIEFEKFDNCTFTFKWKTPYGCLNNKLELIEKQSYVASCKFSNRYNFEYLANHVWSATSFSSGNTYSFIICGEHRFEYCTYNNGVCVRDRYGKYQSGGELMSRSLTVLERDSVRITYVDGDSCLADRAIPRKTIIKLLCSNSPEIEIFVMEEIECTTIIAFISSHVCLKPVHCFDYSKQLGWVADMNSIIPLAHNRIITPFGELVLNLCSFQEHALMEAVPCQFNSPECSLLIHNNNITAQRFIVKHNDHIVKKDPKILGFQSNNFTLSNDGKSAIIKFNEGNVCPIDLDRKISSDLLLVCNDEEYLTTPEPRNQGEDCHYVFEWPVRRICNIKPNIFVANGSCYIEDIISRFKMDLDALTNGNMHELKDEENNTYVIDVCNYFNGVCFAGNLCKKNAKGNFGFGRVTSASFMPDKNITLLFYDQGQPCRRTNYYAEIWLKCDVNTEQITIKQATECAVLIEWRSPNACYTKPPRFSMMLDTDGMNINSLLVKILAFICVLVMILLVIGPPLYKRLQSRVFRRYYENMFGYRKSFASNEQTEDMYMVQFNSDNDSTLNKKNTDENNEPAFEML